MCPHPMYITQLPPTPPFCWGCYRCQSSPAAFHHAWCMEVLVSSVKSQCPSSSVCLFFTPVGPQPLRFGLCVGARNFVTHFVSYQAHNTLWNSCLHVLSFICQHLGLLSSRCGTGYPHASILTQFDHLRLQYLWCWNGINLEILI